MPTTLPILLRLIWEHPANRDHRIRAVGKAALWQAYKRTIRQPFDLRVYDGLRLRAYPDSQETGRFIYYGGLPDYDEMMFMRRYLRPGDNFVDGGANVGAYTLLAASLVKPTGRVDAFEPAPLEARRLRENVALNRLEGVQVHEAALGEAPGHARFTLDRMSGNRLWPADDERPETTVVRVTSIDDELSGTYAMAKLDLEGAEPLALRGAEQNLAVGNPPVLVLELVDRFVRRFGSSAVDVADWLQERRYELGTYDATTNHLELVGRSLAGSLTNVFAIFSDKMTFVTARLAGAGARPAAHAGGRWTTR
jgi:FkbM family methyltransferase